MRWHRSSSPWRRCDRHTERNAGFCGEEALLLYQLPACINQSNCFFDEDASPDSRRCEYRWAQGEAEGAVAVHEGICGTAGGAGLRCISGECVRCQNMRACEGEPGLASLQCDPGIFRELLTQCRMFPSRGAGAGPRPPAP
jgi:hypothetical protein